MNRAKKVIATLTLLVFMFVTYSFSVSAQGVFSDVDPSYQYYNAIERLYQEKIVDGYLAEDGTRTYMPENTITRAEFSKLLAVSLVKDQSLLAATPTGFEDVDKDETISWAVPYISYAVQTKVVSGYPDGTFQPFKEVTYAEAVKMIVCALGYGSQVETTEPWYEGYIKIARNIGSLNNAIADANSPAKRGLVAQLIINMLDVQERNSKLPVIIPGNDGEGGSSAIIVPDEEDEVYEDDGQITAVFDTTLIGRTVGLNKKEIMIDDEKYTLSDSLSYETYIPYVGYECDFEYTEKRNKKTIEKITINNDYTMYEFKDDSLIEDVGTTYFEFYKDAETSKTTKLNISNAAVIYNGYGIETLSAEEKADLLKRDNSTIKLLDNGNNKSVDVAYIDSYETYFVGSVTLDTYTVYDKNIKEGNLMKNIVLDDNLDNIVWQTDKGADSAITSLSKNTTTISVFGPYSGQEYNDIETNTKVIVSKKYVKGSVSSYDSTTEEYTINGKKYKTSKYYEEMIAQGGFNDQVISIGDTGTYYLDHLDNIVYVAVNDSSKFGYITDIAIPQREDKNEYIIYMIANGTEGAQEPKEYTLRDKVDINGKTYGFEDVIPRLKDSADYINANKTVTNVNADYCQPIIFKTTLDGGTIIKSITTIDNLGVEGEEGGLEYEAGILEDDTERINYPSANIFKKNNSTLFQMKFTTSTTSTSTKVFVVPNNRNDEEDYAVYTKSSEVSKYFTVGNSYIVEGFNVNNKIAEIVVVYGATPLVIDGKTQSYLVTHKIESENVDEDEDAYQFTLYELGVKDPQPFTEITTSMAVGADIQPGDVIKFAKRGNYIDKIEKVFVGGELYSPSNGEVDFEQEVVDGNEIHSKYSTTVNYYNVYTGVVYLSDETVLRIAPGFDHDLDEESEDYQTNVEELDPLLKDFSTSTSTYVLIYDGSESSSKRVKYVSTASLTSILEHGYSNAAKIFMYRYSSGSARCIIIYRNVDFIE